MKRSLFYNVGGIFYTTNEWRILSSLDLACVRPKSFRLWGTWKDPRRTVRSSFFHQTHFAAQATMSRAFITPPPEEIFVQAAVVAGSHALKNSITLLASFILATRSDRIWFCLHSSENVRTVLIFRSLLPSDFAPCLSKAPPPLLFATNLTWAA